MSSAVSRIETNPFVSALRAREFSRLDRQGLAYLDYTGSALHADCQMRAHAELLSGTVLGNPHSESDPARASGVLMDAARDLVLGFLDADAAEYVVCFTANTSAAVKLVAEAYPFSSGGVLLLSADNHNSMNGIREYARRASTSIRYAPLDGELRLDAPRGVLANAARGRTGPKLFGFPAQSNFSGVQHPLELIGHAQRFGYDVLLDAAAFLPSNRLSLRGHRPEFVALSFYKLFGYPTGIGALVARRDALAKVQRPWFSGGTVEYASVQNDLHRLKALAGAFEDGTPDFLSVAALPAGFAFMSNIAYGPHPPACHQPDRNVSRRPPRAQSRVGRTIDSSVRSHGMRVARSHRDVQRAVTEWRRAALYRR